MLFVRRSRLLVATICLAVACVQPERAQERDKPTQSLELRVFARDERVVSGKAVPLQPGESVALRIEARWPDGSVKDVTTSAGMRYSSLTPALTVTRDGVVTAVGSLHERPGEFAALEAIMIEYRLDGTVHSTAVPVEVEQPSADRLLVRAPRTTLGVGDSVQLQVLQRLSNGTLRDLTSATTGTRYRSTSELMLVVEPDGRVTCVGTHGRPEESAIIGVTNGNLDGRLS